MNRTTVTFVSPPPPTEKRRTAAAAATRPLSRLLIHDQGDVALDQGEGEEADVGGVLAGRSGLLRPGKRRRRVSVVEPGSGRVVSCSVKWPKVSSVWKHHKRWILILFLSSYLPFLDSDYN